MPGHGTRWVSGGPNRPLNTHRSQRPSLRMHRHAPERSAPPSRACSRGHRRGSGGVSGAHHREARVRHDAVMSELWELSALELAAAIRERAASSREVVEAHLARIDAVNPALNAVVRRVRRRGTGRPPRSPTRRWPAATTSARFTASRSPSRRTSTSPGRRRRRRLSPSPTPLPSVTPRSSSGCARRGDPDRPHQPPRPRAARPHRLVAARAHPKPVGPERHRRRVERRRGVSAGQWDVAARFRQ